MERGLGLQWCVESETFQFKMAIKEHAHTRRGLLSVISESMIVLGVFPPVTLPAKVMLQELCQRRCGWDDSIVADIGHHWTEWWPMEDLKDLVSFKVARFIETKHFGQSIKAQMHNFSDPSEVGFFTITYLRTENDEGKVHVSFLLGKARVTPLKPITIPHLELTAVLAVRVDQMLRTELELQLHQLVFWTNSALVLKYIKNEDKRFCIFVANCVSTIRDLTHVSHIYHVSHELDVVHLTHLKTILQTVPQEERR